MLYFQCCLTFTVATERFKQKDSILKTSAITVVTRSSMKAQSSTTANCHLRGSEERYGEQR